MSVINPFVSNGTCYYAANRETDAAFIPCGNDFFGRKTCCGVGDTCLENKACFNQEHRITYLAGCSDPSYRDASCPDKGDLSDRPWTGLVYCNGTSNQWAACDQAAKPATLEKPDFCFCPQTSRRVAFTESGVIAGVATLPTATGRSIRFETGHLPTDAVTTIGGSTRSNTSPTTRPGGDTTGNPSETGTGAPPPPPAASAEEGLSVGAKAGIGAGVAVAGLVALAAAIFIFLRKRRQAAATNNNTFESHSGPPGGPDMSYGGYGVGGFVDAKDSASSAYAQQQQQQQQPPYYYDPNSVTAPPSTVPGTPSNVPPGTALGSPAAAAAAAAGVATRPSELGGNAARPWSMRSELQGSDGISTVMGSTPSAAKAEFPPSQQQIAHPPSLQPGYQQEPQQEPQQGYPAPPQQTHSKQPTYPGQWAPYRPNNNGGGGIVPAPGPSGYATYSQRPPGALSPVHELG